MNNVDGIIELNHLWKPIRPYLTQFIKEQYCSQNGSILEVGPFSGLAFELARQGVGTSFHMAVFPQEIIAALQQEARELKIEAKLSISETTDALSDITVEAFDLIIFRGAFFFPSFFKPNLSAVYSSLKNGGTALIGGGFGPHTPDDVIKTIEKRSKVLNQVLGRIRVTKDDVWSELEIAKLTDRVTMITDGGLWVVLKK
jgi:hypothetical protein